jgi:threonine dehydrogenase-like Zn-dependent dehydrogenase
MRAAVLREGMLEVRETDDPIPGPGQILVRSLACAVCASDLHFMDHPDRVTEDDSGLWNYDTTRDLVMGHEYCTEVVEYGPDTEHRWPVGTRLTSQPVLITPDAARIIGYSTDAPGGFGEYMLLSEALAHEITGSVSDEHVAVTEAMSVGAYYVRRAQVTRNDVPLVIGCGGIGMAVVAALQHTGAHPIIVADYVASRRELATAIGADVVVDPATTSPFTVWREVALGSGNASSGPAFGHLAAGTPTCVVFECVGLPGVLDEIIVGCERGTRVLAAGGAPQGDFIHTMIAKRKGLNIQFGGGPMPEDFAAALADVCSGAIDVSPIVGRVVGLADTPQAFEDARHADCPPRIVVIPGA